MLFIFEACYGTPHDDYGFDVIVSGTVKSEISGLPIKGIQVYVADTIQYELTDANGQFAIYMERMDTLKIKFEDVDSTLNGLYYPKDTVLTDVRQNVNMQIFLEEK